MIAIEIPNYPKRVKIAEARSKKYYQKGKKKVPKKYQTKNYDFKKWKGRGKKRVLVPDKYLHDIRTNKRVVANPRSAGTPRYAPINGQRIWSSHTRLFDRTRMMTAVKKEIQQVLDGMVPFQSKFPPAPIRIHLEVYDKVIDEQLANKLWDLDNRVIMWQKAFQDCLIGNKLKDEDTGKMKPTTHVFYPDDNVTIITGWEYNFIPSDKPKLIFFIEHDGRPCVQNLNDE